MIIKNKGNHLPYEQLFKIALKTIQQLYDLTYKKMPKAIALLTSCKAVCMMKV